VLTSLLRKAKDLLINKSMLNNMGNRERKKVRAENNDPINFTCGVCKKVHKYNKGYKCTMIMKDSEDEEEQEEEEE